MCKTAEASNKQLQLSVFSFGDEQAASIGLVLLRDCFLLWLFIAAKVSCKKPLVVWRTEATNKQRERFIFGVLWRSSSQETKQIVLVWRKEMRVDDATTRLLLYTSSY